MRTRVFKFRSLQMSDKLKIINENEKIPKQNYLSLWSHMSFSREQTHQKFEKKMKIFIHVEKMGQKKIEERKNKKYCSSQLNE